MTTAEKLEALVRRAIEGYPNYYVADTGIVFSSARGAPHQLKPYKTRSGYLRVQLYHDGLRVRSFVHRIVAQTFIPNPDNKPHVNHLNGDKTDNRAINLEWCTSSENMRHAITNGLRPEGSNRGIKHGNSKLKDSDVLEIRLLKGRLPGRLVAKRYGIHLNTVALIWARKLWAWL